VNPLAESLKGRYIFSTDAWNFVCADGRKYTREELISAGVTLEVYSVGKFRVTYRVK
jgi:hypothetical protein